MTVEICINYELQSYLIANYIRFFIHSKETVHQKVHRQARVSMHQYRSEMHYIRICCSNRFLNCLISTNGTFSHVCNPGFFAMLITSITFK